MQTRRVRVKVGKSEGKSENSEVSYNDPFEDAVCELPGNIGLYLNNNTTEIFEFNYTSNGFILIQYFCKYYPRTFVRDEKSTLFITNFKAYTNKRQIHTRLYKCKGEVCRTEYRNTKDILKMTSGKIVLYHKKFIPSSTSEGIAREQKLFIINKIDTHMLGASSNIDLIELFMQKWLNCDVVYLFEKKSKN